MESEILAKAPPDEHRTIVGLMAPFFLGLVVGYFFWGIQIAQTYYYYRSYRKTDRPWVKIAVAAVFIIDAVGICMVSEVGWQYLVDLWGDPLFPTRECGFGSCLALIMHALAAMCVQFFYAQKIWVIYDGPARYIFVSMIVVLAIAQIVSGIGQSVLMFSVHMNMLGFNRVKPWAVLGNSTGAAADVLIAILMAFKLNKMRTGFKPTDDIISKLIAVVLETGLATAVVQVVLLAVYLGWIHKTYFSVALFIIPRIYSNSMLAVLNSRMSSDKAQIYDSRANKTLDVSTFQTVTADFTQSQRDVPRYEMRNMHPTKNDHKGSVLVTV